VTPVRLLPFPGMVTTARSDAEDCELCALVRAHGGDMRPSELVRRLVARGWERPRAWEEIAAEQGRGHLHERAVVGVGPAGRASTQTVLSFTMEQPHGVGLTPRKLRELREAAGWSLRKLASELHDQGLQTNYVECHRWESGERPIPAVHGAVILRVLGARICERLMTLRKSRDLSQPAAGALVGITGGMVWHLENHPLEGHARRVALIRALEQLPVVEGPEGPGMTVGELEQLVERSPLSWKELARRAGMNPASVHAYRRPAGARTRGGHRAHNPFPLRRQHQLRVILEQAEQETSVNGRDHIRDDVLPAVVELVRDQPGIFQAHVVRALPFGFAAVTEAVALGVRERDLHWAPSRQLCPGPARRMRRRPGLFAGPADSHARAAESPGVDAEKRLLHELLAAMLEGPGRGLKAVREDVGVDSRQVYATAAIARMRELARAEPTRYTDRMGRSRHREGWYVSERGAAMVADVAHARSG
jgi:hypothetical protein